MASATQDVHEDPSRADNFAQLAADVSKTPLVLLKKPQVIRLLPDLIPTPPTTATSETLSASSSFFPPPIASPYTKTAPFLVAHNPSYTIPVSEPISFLSSPDVFAYDNAPCASAVELHVYDLTRGSLATYGEDILHMKMEGHMISHSGLVCFGIEYYFEGGIAMCKPGATRFGDGFTTIPVGTTTRSLPAFWSWLREEEARRFQVDDYHPIRFNCHHFTKAAVEFLLGEEATAYLNTLINSVRKLSATPIGSAVSELYGVFISASLALEARGRCRLLDDKIRYEKTRRMCADNLAVQPPPMRLVFFADLASSVATTTMEQVLPYVRKVAGEAGVVQVRTFISECTSSKQTLNAPCVEAFIHCVHAAMLGTSLDVWGPLLNALRLAVLHKAVCIGVASGPLMQPLLRAARDLPRLPNAAQLSFLRVLCNLGSSHVGAMALADQEYRASWISAVGLGLLSGESGIVYTAACLAHNLAIIMLTAPISIRLETAAGKDCHGNRLGNIIVHNLRARTAEQLPEPALNMLLMALYQLVSCCHLNPRFTQLSTEPWFMSLITRCQSSESVALISMIREMCV